MANYRFEKTIIKGIAVAHPIKNKDVFNKNEDFWGGATYISDLKQTTSDLGFIAAEAIIQNKEIVKDEISVVVFASKTPDYRSPATAMVLHKRLGLSSHCMTFDINIGSTGFETGLQLVCAIIEQTQYKYGLLIVGDTLSKQLSHNINNEGHPFSDCAAAIVIERKINNERIHIITKTFSDYFSAYILPKGGFRNSKHLEALQELFQIEDINQLAIDKSKIKQLVESQFSLMMSDILIYSNKTISSIDHVCLNADFNIDTSNFDKNTTISDQFFFMSYDKSGSTSGATIPLQLATLYGKINGSEEISLLSFSFGEGLSICASSFTISADAILPLIETSDFFID